MRVKDDLVDYRVDALFVQPTGVLALLRRDRIQRPVFVHRVVARLLPVLDRNRHALSAIATVGSCCRARALCASALTAPRHRCCCAHPPQVPGAWAWVDSFLHMYLHTLAAPRSGNAAVSAASAVASVPSEPVDIQKAPLVHGVVGVGNCIRAFSQLVELAGLTILQLVDEDSQVRAGGLPPWLVPLTHRLRLPCSPRRAPMRRPSLGTKLCVRVCSCACWQH